ncbi:MAG: DEAD/DEAH box helicase [Pseudomonadota bacterium]
MSGASSASSFSQLALPEQIIKALKKVGYETPSSIQSAVIPFLLAGKDIIGQAQTGTGKTAAFALPLLAEMDLKIKTPQVLVLTPTRELAIQVSEAFQRYASFMKGFHVLPVYGGQEYGIQLRQLKRGVHVVVGTPGRVMDHMRRKTLKLDALSCLVLDEADEMLRMGFIDDVEWILEKLPEKKQIALFSATMPAPIRKISKRYLNDPEQITIESKSITADTIKQQYLFVNNRDKLDTLTNILESIQFNAIIIFVRTKLLTLELAEKLTARGYACSALNGDISQRLREQTINRFKRSELDLLVATDVAARGLDVERVSHVINYDIPNDPEAYTHRIGRTGRAGRQGESILFVTTREKHLLRTIEKVTDRRIEQMPMPSTATINRERISRFKQQITESLHSPDNELFRSILIDYSREIGADPLDIAAALAVMTQGEQPFLLEDKPTNHKASRQKSKKSKKTPVLAKDMERFRIEVGWTAHHMGESKCSSGAA